MWHGSLQNINQCPSKTCLLSKYFFKPGDHILSIVSQRSQPCINKDNYPATCNSANIMYLLTYSTCHLKYVGETAQKLNVRFGKHRVR